jgi:hypothetical protein
MLSCRCLVPSCKFLSAKQISLGCHSDSCRVPSRKPWTAKQISVECIATDVECQVDSSRVPSRYLWDAQQMAMDFQANIPAVQYILLVDGWLLCSIITIQYAYYLINRGENHPFPFEIENQMRLAHIVIICLFN